MKGSVGLLMHGAQLQNQDEAVTCEGLHRLEARLHGC